MPSDTMIKFKVIAFCSAHVLHITLYLVNSTSHRVLKKNHVFPILIDTKYFPSALKRLEEGHPLDKEKVDIHAKTLWNSMSEKYLQKGAVAPLIPKS